jgi:glycosyltransferase involved in cell wall biosynthesis
MIHLVGVPHTSLDEDAFSNCAFTALAARWTRVLELIDEPVTAYWAGGPTSVKCEVVEVISAEEREEQFGKGAGTLMDDAWGQDWSLFHDRVIAALLERVAPGDIIASVGGANHQVLVNLFRPSYLVIEPFVGYQTFATGTECCFPSYAWMHNRYGAAGLAGRYYDAVIPHWVEPADFEYGEDGGYALFIGRLIAGKGPHVAAEIARDAGLKLKIAGTGMKGRTWVGIRGVDGPIEPCEYVGPVNREQRKELLSHARVLLMPTSYLEPFGIVQVEALMSGVPVIAPDFGASPEIIREGDGGLFRIHAQAVELAGTVQRGRDLRERAVARYSPEAVAPRYAEWLWRLRTFLDDRGGWYAKDYPDRFPESNIREKEME